MKAFPALIIILIISVFTASCKNETNKEEKLKTFDLKIFPEVTTVKLSDLGFKNIEYIPLETTDSSLIDGNYSPIGGYKILSGYGFFIIKHYSTILKFRDDGSFDRKIGTIGRGPDEFLICHDIDTDECGQIYTADAWKEMFYKYSGDGELVNTFKSPLVRKALEFSYSEGKFLCYNQNNLADIANSFDVIDTNGILLKSFPNKYPFTRHPSAFGFNHKVLFYKFNNRIFTKEVYCDTIFAFDNMYFTPHMVIEAGDKLITPEIRSKTEGLDILKKYINPFNLFEFGNYVYYEVQTEFILSKGSKVNAFIGSKKDDFKAFIDSEKGLINDLDGGPAIVPITTKDDNTVIAMVEAMELKNYIASDTFKNSDPKYPEKKKQLETIAGNIKDTDNPILILVSM